jgi:hypothetical protein
MLTRWVFVLVCIGSLCVADERSQAPRRSCFWSADVSARVLKRHLGAVEIPNGTVAAAVDVLRAKYTVPLSFIEAEDPAISVALNLSDTDVDGVLTALVSRATEYRYGVVRDRLFLYPREAKYDAVLADFSIQEEARLGAAYTLAERLKRLEGFVNVAPPVVAGVLSMGDRPPVYADLVTIPRGSTIVQAFAELAGRSPSAVVSLQRQPVWKLSMIGLGEVSQVASFRVAATPTKSVVGDTVAISVIATDRDGVVHDLSGPDCGVQYSVDRHSVAEVEPDGKVSFKAGGRASVFVRFGTELGTVTFDVTATASPKPPTQPGRS